MKAIIISAIMSLMTVSNVMAMDFREQVQILNRKVNSTIKPAEDMAQYTIPDVWVLNPVEGDCEDYAVTKMVALQNMGVTDDRMSIIVVKYRKNENHAVLLVDDMVLDNRYKKLLREKDYTVIRKVSPKVALFRVEMDRILLEENEK